MTDFTLEQWFAIALLVWILGCCAAYFLLRDAREHEEDEWELMLDE